MAKFTKLSSLDYAEKFLYNGVTCKRGKYNRSKRMYMCYKHNNVRGLVSVSGIYLPGTFIVEKL